MNRIPQRVAEFFLVPVIFLAGLFFLQGCASSDPQISQLSRQQAATIESLNAEIARLNSEIDETIYARERLNTAKSELIKTLSDEIASGEVVLAMEKRGLSVRFLENALFEPEQIELRTSAKAALNKIAEVLKGEFSANRIILEGHTDEAMPAGSGWKSSWEYTGALASEVLHYFVEARGLNPARFTVVACAEFQKADTRDTAGGRELNRRVEIVLTPEKLEKGG